MSTMYHVNKQNTNTNKHDFLGKHTNTNHLELGGVAMDTNKTR